MSVKKKAGSREGLRDGGMEGTIEISTLKPMTSVMGEFK